MTNDMSAFKFELKFRNSAVSKPWELEPKFRTCKILKFYGVKLWSEILEF